MPNFESIGSYIASQPNEVEIPIEELRRVVKEIAPEAVEPQIHSSVLVSQGKRDQKK